MSTLGEVFVCLLQIILFQFIATPIFRNSTYMFALVRNPEWLKQNPKTLEDFPAPQGRFHWYLGIVLIIIVLASIYIPQLEAQRWIINIISAMVMGLQIFLTYLNSSLKLKKIIPLKIKKATLKRRTLSQILPTNIKLAITLLLMASIILKIILFQNTNFEYRPYFTLDILGLIFFISIAHIVKKQPICHDFEIDFQYRKLEATLTGLVIAFFFASSLIYNLGDLGFINDETITTYKSFAGTFPLTLFAIFILYAKPVLQNIKMTVREIFPI